MWEEFKGFSLPDDFELWTPVTELGIQEINLLFAREIFDRVVVTKKYGLQETYAVLSSEKLKSLINQEEFGIDWI